MLLPAHTLKLRVSRRRLDGFTALPQMATAIRHAPNLNGSGVLVSFLPLSVEAEATRLLTELSLYVGWRKCGMGVWTAAPLARCRFVCPQPLVNRSMIDAPARRVVISPGRTGTFNISVRVHQTASYHNAMLHASCRKPIGGGCFCNKTAEAVHRTLHGKQSLVCQRCHDRNGTKANTSHSQRQTADHWSSTCRACRKPGELSKKKRSPPGCVTSMVLFGVGVCGGQQKGGEGRAWELSGEVPATRNTNIHDARPPAPMPVV